MTPKLSAVGLLSLFFCLGAAQAQAATNSNQVSVSLSAQLISSLTLTVAAPVTAFGIVTPGSSTTAALPVSVVSAWVLNSGQTVKLYSYFTTASSAMTGTVSGVLIPVSALTGSVNGGSAAAFSQTNPFGGALAIQMYSQTLTSSTAIGGRTDSIDLTLNLSGLSLAADTYTGTMYLQAQAM